jgi:hypothetical protein
MEGAAKSLDKAAKANDAPQARTAPRQSASTGLESPSGFAGVQQNAGNLAIQRLFNAGLIQAKLSVSQPNDPYEQEAGRMADQVVGQLGTPVPRISATNVALQRKCAACTTSSYTCPKCTAEGEDKTQPTPLPGSSAPVIQRQTGTFSAPPRQQAVAVQPVMASGIQRLVGAGEPLPEPTRTAYESRLGADLRQVCIHTDAHAAQTASSLNAKAFTIGHHIVFANGKYQPHTTEGKRLIAHELTHTIQQTSHSASVEFTLRNG